MDNKIIKNIIDMEHAAVEAVVKAEKAVEHAAVEAAHAIVEAEHKAIEKLKSAAGQFFKLEAAGGIMLVIAAMLALVVANSPLAAFYQYVLNDVVFRIGLADPGEMTIGFQKSILHWINDGMMAIFFFLVGLEIKRELMEGELSSRERATCASYHDHSSGCRLCCCADWCRC